MNILEMVKGVLVIPKIFHIKNGLIGRIAYTTTSNNEKTVVVCPYHMSSEKIHQVLMTEITGMCRSYINQFL